ncbi:MAG: hypothetical protein HYW70_00965 [Candidatus Nealsonbacteria bacterium]|nr:hypothetical protein [Candidatus Nealsonbacteria bacterium]
MKGKIGASYDILEAITKGLINSKKKEICSGLAAFCLPPDIKREISEQYNAGRLRKGSIRTKKNDPENPKFVSPNGLAEYFGAPPA